MARFYYDQEMELDPAQRFSSRVEAYARFRPSYPRELLNLLERSCGLTAASKIADVGSGTGLLARLFLDFGCDVTAVEPNPGMRAAAERALSGESGYHSVDGRAEATTLPDASVDFVTAGQAFHWFEPAAAREEFRRILKPAGWAVLIWNERLVTPGFMAEHEAALDRFAREKQHPATTEITAFYGHAEWRLERVPNRQSLDEEGLRGRVESSSWSPLPGTEGYLPMAREMSRLFEKYQRGGRVTIEYETNIYYGRL
jgi:SAM-dependent methyltransferase